MSYQPVPQEKRKRWANNEALDALFKKRKKATSITDMCADLTLSRPAVSQVLSGVRTGTITWKRMGKFMTAEEWQCARDFANAARVRMGLPTLKEIQFQEQPGSHDVVC